MNKKTLWLVLGAVFGLLIYLIKYLIGTPSSWLLTNDFLSFLSDIPERIIDDLVQFIACAIHSKACVGLGGPLIMSLYLMGSIIFYSSIFLLVYTIYKKLKPKQN